MTLNIFGCMGAFILGSIVSVAGFPPELSATVHKKPVPSLAIYYGYPSLINGVDGDMDRAVDAFSPYDIIVFGDGLEFNDQRSGRLPVGPGSDEHQRAARILTRLRESPRSPELYGYVALGQMQHLVGSEIDERVALWSAMGVTGIFFDEAGRDYGVTRQRLATAVGSAHERGLNVCVNAFEPADVLGPDTKGSPRSGHRNARAVDTPLEPQDAVLLESFAVRLGIRQARDEVATRARRALALSDAAGVRVFGVSTAAPDGSFNADDLVYARSLAESSGLDAFGWGEPQYGATDSRLPWRAAYRTGKTATSPRDLAHSVRAIAACRTNASYGCGVDPPRSSLLYGLADN
jgi:hypothetical protein